MEVIQQLWHLLHSSGGVSVLGSLLAALALQTSRFKCALLGWWSVLQAHGRRIAVHRSVKLRWLPVCACCKPWCLIRYSHCHSGSTLAQDCVMQQSTYSNSFE